MNRFPISRVDHVRALPDRRLVVRAPCPMCGRPQLELPIGPNTRCRDCGVGLRYVSNHLVPSTSLGGLGTSRSLLHPPAVGNGRVAPRARPHGKTATRKPAVAEKPNPRRETENGSEKSKDPAAAELDWVFAPGADDASRKNGVEIPERLTGATPEEFARTIA